MDWRTATLAGAFVLCWNSGFIGAEFVLAHAGVFTQIFWRYLALALLLGFGLAIAGKLRWPGTTVAGVNAGIGLLAHAVWLGAVLLALEWGVPAGIVALIIALQPMITGLFSHRITGECVSLRKWLGLLVGFIGVLLTVIWRVRAEPAEPWLWLLLKRLDVTRVESLFYLGPPVTMLMSWLAFGDTLKPTDLIGLATICAGVLLTSKNENAESHGNAT